MQLLACCERPPFELSSQICRRLSLRQVTQLSSARPIPEGLLIDVNFGSAITIIPESPVPKRECLSNMLPGLGQKRVAQSVKSGVWVGLDSGSQPPHLRLQYPGAKRLGGISRMGEDMVALRHRKKRLEYCPHRLVNLEGTFGARRFSPGLITREP
jgi:hypothetical protein